MKAWPANCGAGLAQLIATLAVAGCAGADEETSGANTPLCSPRFAHQPCGGARVAVDYRIRIWTHCGVHTAYLDGRWWRIDPPQPEGSNWIAGTTRLLDRKELHFTADDGRRYAFTPAPPAFVPPPCY